MQPALRRHEPRPRRTSSTSIRSSTASAGSGFDWEDRLYYASDYFEQIYDYTVGLIKAGKAYVDELTADEIREHRGTLTEPGRESPWRNRPVAESLDLFERMRSGRVRGRRQGAPREDRHGVAEPQHARPGDLPDPARDAPPDGRRVVHLPDVRLHPRHLATRSSTSPIRSARSSSRTTGRSTTGPWTTCPVPSKPRQIEFARLNLTYTVMSKRKLLQLVQEGLVDRLGRPADADHRRPPAPRLSRPSRSASSPRGSAWRSARTWWTWRCSRTAVRDDLNRRAPRALAVLRPLRVVIDNYPEGQVEEIEVVNNPEDPSMGTRKVPFSRELFIEQDDFREVPPHEVLPAVARARGAPARHLFRHVRARGEGRPDGRGRRDALHLRPGHARRRRAGRTQGEGDDPLGVGPARRGRRGAAVRPPVHRARTCTTPRRDATGSRISTRPRSRSCVGARWSPRWPRPRRCRQFQFERLGLLLRRPGQRRRAARVQPDRAAARHVGADRAAQ